MRPGLLKRVSAVEPHEYPLWKQRILVLLGLAQATYRKGKYDDCLTLLGECAAALKSLSTVARDPAARSLGTWARVHYLYGQVRREQNRLTDADASFVEAIWCADGRLASRCDPQGRVREEVDATLANWTVARCLVFGLGRNCQLRGELRAAESLILPGLVLLRNTGDWIQRAYAELLLGKVRRAKAGRNEQALESATTILRRAYEIFVRSGHNVYQARAARELGLAYSCLSGCFS